jgi:hypothetical protein
MAASDTWTWFFSPVETRLYHSEGPFYRVFTRASHHSTRITNARFTPMDTLALSVPLDAQLSTVSKVAQGSYQLTGTGNIPQPHVEHPIDYSRLTIEEVLDLAPPLDQWAVADFHSDDDGMTLAMGLIQGNATAVSDGSYKDNLGTSGFVLCGPRRKLAAIGSNVVPGNPDEQSSYRSELVGISGVLAVVTATCMKCNIQEGSIRLALDGKQALLKASSTWPRSPTDMDFDLLCDIRKKITRLPVTITWQWIEGHQDTHRPYHTLSGLAQDNVQADQIAKFRLNRCGCQGSVPSPQRFADEGWSISLRGRKLSKLDFRKLYASMWAGTALDYWATKHDLPFTTVLSIDWDTHGEALQSLSFGRRRHVVKHASGQALWCRFGAKEMGRTRSL